MRGLEMDQRKVFFQQKGNTLMLSLFELLADNHISVGLIGNKELVSKYRTEPKLKAIALETDKECCKEAAAVCQEKDFTWVNLTAFADKVSAECSEDDGALEEEERKGFKVAYIVFKRSDSVQKALTLPYSKPLLLSTAENPVVTGIEKWKQHYLDQTTDVAEMKKEVTRFMEEYDKKVEEEQKQAKEMDGVPDDDGWITVTRVGKNKGAPRTEAEEKRVTIKDRKKRKEKELVNFYSFQIRESKKQHIVELRKKFEEDKQRIAMMKAARKFRPY
nr:hypothetical protein BaRGS_027324 [Batillaria attramentaria]